MRGCVPECFLTVNIIECEKFNLTIFFKRCSEVTKVAVNLAQQTDLYKPAPIDFAISAGVVPFSNSLTAPPFNSTLIITILLLICDENKIPIFQKRNIGTNKSWFHPSSAESPLDGFNATKRRAISCTVSKVVTCNAFCEISQQIISLSGKSRTANRVLIKNQFSFHLYGITLKPECQHLIRCF